MIKRETIWSVFPVQANDKKPYPFLRNKDNQRGFYVATTNEEEIASWERMYRGCNWALRTGTASGCWVLDIDVKNGARGEESFFDLIGDHKDFPDTLAVKTPSGGMHYYFEMEPGIRTVINGGKYGGIDIKADGGYVLIPPSVIEGKAYEYFNENKITKAPQWLKDTLFPYKPSNENNEVERIPQDDFRSESLAKFLLKKYLPKAVKGMRNQVLMDMLCQMRDNIIPSNIAEEMAKEYARAMRDRDFTEREALSTCRSVYRRAAREANYVDIDVTFNIKEAPVLKNYDQAGIADYILGLHKNIVYIPEKSWAVYEDDGYWHTQNADALVADWIVDELRNLSNSESFKGSNSLFKVNKKNVDDIMAFMKRKVIKPLEQFNEQPNLINVKNGVIDLRTLELYKHNAGFFFDYVLDVNYNPNADMTKWNKFLRESLENADKYEEGGIYQLELLQLAAGYSITGETNEECLFYIYGKTRSGKSTFINTINEILGPLGSTIQMSALMQKRYVSDTQNFEIASLINKRFVVSSETDRDTYLDSAKIKNLTGRDTIKCAFKFKDPFQAKVKFKMWLTSNNEISVDATDEAVWGRFRTFSFPYSKQDNVDINLKDNLMKDKDGIFLWLCYGAHVWYSLKDRGQRLPIPASMKSYLKSRKEELDSFNEFLVSRGYYPVDKGVEDASVVFLSNHDIYNKYCAWCDLNQIKNRYSKNTVMQLLTQKGFQKDMQRVGGVPCRGIWVRLVSLD